MKASRCVRSRLNRAGQAAGPRIARKAPAIPLRSTTAHIPKDETPQTAQDSSQAFPYNPYEQSGPQASTSQMQFSEAEDVPVIVAEDPHGMVKQDDPAATMLATQGLVVVRQLEMINVFLGYEQANRYQILSPSGQPVGYLAEEDLGFTSAIGRQVMRTHRPFKCTVMDLEGNVTLRIHRPFSFINSRITVSLGQDPDNIIGECQQEWHPWRRKYNLFLNRNEGMEQFAKIDSGFLSFDFYPADENGKVMAAINRQWGGIGREMFTDTGQYALKFDAVNLEDLSPAAASVGTDETGLVPIHQGLTLDQRAVLLATAMTCDIDFFSRKSSGGGIGSMLPFMIPFPSGSDNQGDVEPNAEDTSSLGSSYGSSDTGELPRSADADAAAEERGWDDQIWGGQEAPLDEGEVMQDPWGDEQEGSSWSDFFGGDGDE